jgi:probable phosphoglycerate mutase
MRDTLVDLIRHGEPVGGRRYRGSGLGSASGTDDPLSPLGWAQMRQALGDAHPWHQIVSSPLARCRGPAAELAGRHGLPLAVEQDLREIGMGAWEGRTHDAVAAEDSEVYRAVQANPMSHRPAGGEPLGAFVARVSAAYERQAAAHPGRHLLIFCHAGVMRALVGHLLLADPVRWWRLRIDYAHIVRVRHGPFGPALECVNASRLPE